MTKTEFVKEFSNRIEMTQKDTAPIVDTFFETIKEVVASGEKIAIAGFGSWEIVERAQREGRNPATGEPIVIAASKAPKFKAAKAFKDAVNEA